MKKQKETVSFTKNDIEVFVRIDYINNQIGLVEKDRYNKSKFKMKSYNFVNRGVEYVGGWLKILDAMKYAMEEAKKMYEHNLAIESELKMEAIIKNVNKNSRA
jgi:hypothetical protein